jgi:archaellum component FlaF (FlaF/FlaG flagellin family)
MPDATPPAPPSAPAAPATPAATPAKSGLLPKILLGCLGLVVLIGILVSVGVWWGARKLGLTDAARNPAAMAAKLIAAGNPDVEVVSQDDARQTVTLRNKKTGETVTMNASQLKEGKLEFSDEKGEKLTIGGEKGAVTVTNQEGTTTVGGEASAPAWVPAYPGAKPQGTFSKTSERGATGAFSFQTADAVAKVMSRFEADLQGGGFQVQKTLSGESTGVIAAKHGDGREVNLTATRSGDSTVVTVQYEEKKK